MKKKNKRYPVMISHYPPFSERTARMKNLAELVRESRKPKTMFPRKDRLDLNTNAEIAIHEVIHKVEALGADPKLTEVVILLSEAKDILGDYVNEQLNKVS